MQPTTYHPTFEILLNTCLPNSSRPHTILPHGNQTTLATVGDLPSPSWTIQSSSRQGSHVRVAREIPSAPPNPIPKNSCNYEHPASVPHSSTVERTLTWTNAFRTKQTYTLSQRGLKCSVTCSISWASPDAFKIVSSGDLLSACRSVVAAIGGNETNKETHNDIRKC